MKCLTGHEIKTDRGFRVFEAGVDYPAEEIKGREKYFEKEAKAKKPAVAEEEKKLPEPEPETERPPKYGRKINKEVKGDDATS